MAGVLLPVSVIVKILQAASLVDCGVCAVAVNVKVVFPVPPLVTEIT